MLTRILDRLALFEGTIRAYLENRRAVVLFREAHGRRPYLAPPISLNDNYHWRKFFDHDPIWVTFNDKLAVKDWVRGRMPELPVAELLWQGEDPADLPETLLHQAVVIKASHGCGFNILHDGSAPDMDAIRATLGQWLATTYGKDQGEWAYGHIPRRVFVERRITCRDGGSPEMLNVHVIGGAVAFAALLRNSGDGTRQLGFLTETGERLPLQQHWGPGTTPLPDDWQPPPSFFRAIEAARTLGQGLDCIRCDIMCCDHDIWFGEMTTYSSSGRQMFSDRALADRLFAGWDIRNTWFMRTAQSGWRERYRRALARRMARDEG
jgi:hypothetical protein